MATRLKPANTETVEDVLADMDKRSVAPPAYQAEVVRGQICDDLNRRFWRGRTRLANAIEDRKERIQRDYDKLPAPEFLAKYDGWRFL